jgi:hypothetical protein
VANLHTVSAVVCRGAHRSARDLAALKDDIAARGIN